MSAKQNLPGRSARATNGSESAGTRWQPASEAQPSENAGTRLPARAAPRSGPQALRAEGWRGLFRRSGGVARLMTLALVLCLLPLLVILLFHQDAAAQGLAYNAAPAQVGAPQPQPTNPTVVPTDTSPTVGPTATNTPVPPTNTPTLVPTDTATFTATATDTATATLTPTETSTVSPTTTGSAGSGGGGNGGGGGSGGGGGGGGLNILLILLLLLGVVVLGGGGFALYYYTSSRSPKPAPQGAPGAVGGVGRWGAAAAGRVRGALWQQEDDEEYDDEEYYDDEDEYEEDEWEDGEEWEEDDPYYDQRGGWNGGAQTGRSNVTGPGWNGVTGTGPASPGRPGGGMSRPSGWTGQGPTQSRPTWGGPGGGASGPLPGGGASGPLPPPPRRPTR